MAQLTWGKHTAISQAHITSVVSLSQGTSMLSFDEYIFEDRPWIVKLCIPRGRLLVGGCSLSLNRDMIHAVDTERIREAA